MVRKHGAGRPPKAPEDRKSTNLTIRMRKALRDQLGRASRVSGRSLSEEAETRLLTSFEDDEIGDKRPIYEVVRDYFRILGVNKGFDVREADNARAVQMGLSLIVDAVTSGSLPENRIRQFFMHDLEGLSSAAKTAAFAAFTSAHRAGYVAVELGDFYPMMWEWMKEAAETTDKRKG